MTGCQEGGASWATGWKQGKKADRETGGGLFLVMGEKKKH